MIAQPWCPFAERAESPNFTPGRADVRAAVLHITDGSFASSYAWLRNPKSRVSSHFLVARDGRTVQFVALTDTAWANGLAWDAALTRWRNARNRLVTPRWPLLTPPVSPNRQTISIEHEGSPHTPWTAAQRAASVRLLRYIADVTGLVYVPGQTLIRHADLDTVDKANCPGPLVDLVAIGAAANIRTAPAPTPAPTRPYVVIAGPARVRVGPTTKAHQLRSLKIGTPVDVTRIVSGLSIAGDDGWCELAGGGYVWRGLLKEAA